MKKLIFLIILIPSTILGQNSGFYAYPLQSGKVITILLKDEFKKHLIFNNFFNDFNNIEESTTCELNNSMELVNCKKLTDSTYYWNAQLSPDSSFYILTAGKSSTQSLIDTVVIEKRDLNLNLLQIYKYHSLAFLSAVFLTTKDSTFKIFTLPDLSNSDSLLEFTLDSDLDLSKITVESHFLNNNYITFIKPLKESQKYIAWYLGGLAITDNTFVTPKYLDDKKLFVKGSIIDAIDSGYVAFGGAKSNIDGSGLAIVKYNPELNYTHLDEVTEDTASYELPAVSYTISKNKTDYYISGFIGANKGNLAIDTFLNLIYIGKYDKDINRVWLKKVGGDRHYYVWGVDALEEGGCCIYGMTRSAETDYQTIPFIMCVDNDGLITSTEEPSISYFDFTIFGNPGGNKLNFKLGDFDEDMTYQVTNMSGQLITKGKGVAGLNTISAERWPVGMYIVTFIHNGKLIHSEKWIKASN